MTQDTADSAVHGEPTAPDRRAVLRGAGAAAVGISSLALPGAAAALSVAGARIEEVTVFWSEGETGGATGNRIGRLTFDGTSASAVEANWLTGLPDPQRVTTDGTSLFYTVRSNDTSLRGIWRVDPDTRANTRIVNVADAGPAFVDAEHIYYPIWGQGLYRIAKDGSGATATLLLTDRALGDLQDVGVVGAGEPAVGGAHDDRDVVDVTNAQQRVLGDLVVDRQACDDLADLLGVGTSGQHATLCLEDARRRDHLHGARDLLRALDRLDAAAQLTDLTTASHLCLLIPHRPVGPCALVLHVSALAAGAAAGGQSWVSPPADIASQLTSSPSATACTDAVKPARKSSIAADNAALRSSVSFSLARRVRMPA
jgi:hypothetical protein